MWPVLLLMLSLQPRVSSPACAAGDDWTFALRAIERVPRWDAREERPPLPPRAAVHAARALLRRMSCPNPDDWELEEVTLRPIRATPGAWIYLVTLTEPLSVSKGGVIGSVIRRSCRIPVMMDGTAPAPATQTHKHERDSPGRVRPRNDR